MLNIQELVDKIKEKSGKEITTKELKDLGISNYHINKLIDNGSLIRISHGKYEVTIKKAFNQHDDYVLQKKFEDAVFKGEIEKAYYYLKTKANNRLSDKYNYQMTNYFIMLEALLDEKADYDYQKNLSFNVLADKTSYSKYFKEFINAVKEKRYEEAFRNLERFKLEEFIALGDLTTSTMIFSKLMNMIVTNKIMVNYFEQYKKYSSSDLSLEKELNEKNYIEAYLSAVERAMYSTHDNYLNSRRIADLLKMIILLSRGEVLEEKNIDYSLYKTDSQIFNTSLKLGDYLTSYKYIGKLCYLSPSKNLKIMKTLLHQMIDINNQNKKKTLVPKKIIQESKIEVKEEKEKNILSDDLIKKLILNKDYKTLKELILEKKKSSELSRLEHYVLKLIKGLFDVQKYGYDHVYHNYVSPEDDYFHLFFEAIKVEDFKKANEIGKIAITRASNTHEFQIYMMILEHIELENKKYEEQSWALKNISKINESLKNILDKYVVQDNVINKEDIELIWDLISSKYEMLKVLDGKTYIEEKVLCILDTINQAEQGLIKENDFENLSDDKLSLNDNLKNCLDNGDYIRANDLLSKNSFNLFKPTFKSHDLKLLRLLFKYMLSIMKENVDVKLQEDEETPNEKLVSKLDEIICLFKNKKDASLALTYFLDNTFDGISEELNCDIAAYLAYLSSVQKNKANELYMAFKESKKSNNISSIKEALEEYKNYIINTSLDRDITHHYNRIEILKRDFLDPNYEIKEELFNTSQELFNQRKYPESLEYINKYIELDNENNSKGYILKGRILEKMFDVENAKKVYLHVLNISPEPIAYYRLACINQNEGNFEEAIKYMLIYEDKRPNMNSNSNRILSALYKAIDNKEKSDFYYRRYKRLLYRKNDN